MRANMGEEGTEEEEARLCPREAGGWGKSNRGAWQVGPACHRLNERVSGGGDGLVLLGRRMSSRPGPCCLVNWPSAN